MTDTTAAPHLTGGTGFIGGGRPIIPATGDLSQLLQDPISPHFELTSVWHEAMTSEAMLCMDCQSGVMAVLNQNGTLQVIDVEEDSLLLQARVKNPHKVFVDPFGAFVAVTALDGEVHVYAIHEERLLASFSLQVPPGSSGLASSSLPSLSSMFLRGTVHVGHCVCWVRHEEVRASAPSTQPPQSKADGSDIHLLIGTQKGGLLFSVCIALGGGGGSGGGSPRGAKATIQQVLTLPDFFVGGVGDAAGSSHAPIASVVYERVSARPGAQVFLAVATPFQLYRVSVSAEEARSADQLLGLLSSAKAVFAVKTVRPSVVASGGVPQSSYGTLNVFRSHAESPARSFAWSSVAGLVHGLFDTQPGEPLRPDEEAMFWEPTTDKPPCCAVEATIPFPKVRPESKANAENEGGGGLSLTDAFPAGGAMSPHQVVLTAFHMILVYETRCIVLNHPAGLPWQNPLLHTTTTTTTTTSDEDPAPTVRDIVSRIRFDPFRGVRHMEALKGVVRDVGERRLYVYSETQLWELQIDNEHRQQWRLFLDRAVADQDGALSLGLRRRLFDAAYNLCRFHDAQRSVVQYLRGRFYLAVGATDKATSVLADCELVDHVMASLLLPARHRGRSAGGSGALTTAEAGGAGLADDTNISGNGGNDGSGSSKADVAPQPDLLVEYLAKRFCYLARFQVGSTDEQQQHHHEELASFALLAVGLAAPKPESAEATTDAIAAAAAAEKAAMHLFLDRVVKGCEAALPASMQRTVFDVLLRTLEEQGHGAAATHLAEKAGRYCLVVAHHLAHGDGGERKAIEVFAKYMAGRPDMADMWYRYSRQLLRRFPIAAVTAMLKVCAKDAQAGRAPGTLDMERLLPAFADYAVECNEEEDNMEHQVITLLEQCIYHFDCVSTAVHDFYIALLAAQGDTERLEEVLESSLFYNAHAALRVCLTHRCLPAIVLLYKRLGLYEDAVLTALQEGAPPPLPPHGGERARGGRAAGVGTPWPGLSAAQELLRGLRQRLEEEVYKRLWRIVAEFTIERGQSARLALAVVEHSDGVLQLSDVLGSIDDSHVLQEFKGAICASLDRYAGAIAQLHERQEETYRTAEVVKRELGDLRNQYGYVTAKQTCPLCHRGLLHGSEPMLVYANCHHVVHERCAIELLESLGGLDAFLTDEGVSLHLLHGVGAIEELAQVDCVICGEAAIVQLDIPLCEEDPSWAID